MFERIRIYTPNFEVHEMKKTKMVRKISRILYISSMLVMIIIAIGIWESHTERDVENYAIFDKYCGYGNLWVFPKEISETATNVEYYYFDMNTLMDPTCQIYLCCTYDTETYQKEVDRLSQIKYEMNGLTKSIQYEENIFAYPAYVSIYEWESCYEYALVDAEEQKIVYVFMQGIPKWMIAFDEKYSPYYMSQEGKKFEKMSIYLHDGYFKRDLKW